MQEFLSRLSDVYELYERLLLLELKTDEKRNQKILEAKDVLRFYQTETTRRTPKRSKNAVFCPW